MKKIVSLLLVAGLVASCSQPKPRTRPRAAYAPLETSERAPKAPAVQPKTGTAPATASTAPVKTAPEAVTPQVSTNHVARAMAPGAPEAATNAPAPSPFGHPEQPAVPALPASTTAAATGEKTNAEPLLPELSVNFHAAPIDLVLQTYADFVHRTLLRSPSINSQATITLVQQNPLTKTELIQAMDAVLAMNNIAMVPIGDKFIKVVPVSDVQGAGMTINDMNASMLPQFGPYDTHIVQLKYTKPSEMVPILQQFTKTPGAVLPIEGSGMIVLRDTAENVRVMLDVISRLDTTVPAEIESEVIPIKYALASDIANALNALSGSGGGTVVGGSSGRSGSLGTSRTTGMGGSFGGGGGFGGAGGGFGGAGGGFGGQYGQQGTMGGAFGNRSGFGSTPTAGGSASPSFTDRVRNLIDRAGGGKGGEFQILGQTKIIADERMNALLVFANHEDMQMIKKVVGELDKVLAQVLIEAIIMEVTLDNSQTIGLSAAQNPTGKHNVYEGGYNNGQNFFGTGDSNSFPGNFTSALPGNMFSYWGSFGNNFQVALQAAASEGRVNVLSRPRIQTSHGVEADLFVGETIPYVDSTTAGAFGGTGVYNSYQQQQIGITLKVKPLINPDGLVVMDIYQEASEPGPSSTAVNINGTEVPTINQRQAAATVAVKDKDTIILGGMISTTQSKTKSGVPYLKDIPLIGNLFRSTANTEERVELIVLLRPTVLPTPEAAASVAAAEQRRLPGVRAAEAEIHADEAARMKAADQEMKDAYKTNFNAADPFD